MTEENAAILRDEQGPAQKPPALPFAVPTQTRAVSVADRRDLDEMVNLPGWQVYLRIQQKALEDHREHAISVSESSDALRRAEEIATRWAYASMYKAIHVEMIARVMKELQELRSAE